MKPPAAGRGLSCRFWATVRHGKPESIEAVAREALAAGVGPLLADQVRKAIADLLSMGKGDTVTRLRPALAILTRGDPAPGARRAREGLS